MHQTLKLVDISVKHMPTMHVNRCDYAPRCATAFTQILGHSFVLSVTVHSPHAQKKISPKVESVVALCKRTAGADRTVVDDKNPIDLLR